MIFGLKKTCFYVVVLIFISCQSTNDSYQTWEVYKGDATSSSYSSLDQINKGNISDLKVAWTYRTGDLIEDHPRTGMETNPIIIDNVMYAVSPHMKIVAVDATNGVEKWIFDPFKGERATWKLRAVVYWEAGADKRILFTAGTWLYALNAETGKLVPNFGRNGRVNMNKGLGRDSDSISVMASSPGIIYNDLLIMGSAVGESIDAAPGHIRAYDVRTGEIAWIFHTIPQPGEPGFETWENMSQESLDKRGGANNWTGMALDTDRGIVYVPTGSPVFDFYGRNRPGKNLYSNSLLALNAATGDYIWHYQIIHHDLWDYDLPAPPNLLTIEREGKTIDVVAQVTKQGFTFVFDRETGESVFPIEERSVPQSNLVGENSWPTQPFPTKPEPFARQSFTLNEITDISPEAHEYVLAEMEQYRNEGLFTPPDSKGSVVLPGLGGAANWGGAAHDPESGILFINAKEDPRVSTVQQIRGGSSLADETLLEKGRSLYVQNCAACHGMNKEGQLPDLPSLINIKETMSEETVLEFIEVGGSMMPAFPAISEEEKRAIITYLFEQESPDVPIEEEEHSSEEVGKENGEFINVSSQKRFVDQDGYPAIKPPWGTLNAIDLNSGEYKWTIPLGTYPELAEKGLPPTGMSSWGGPIVTKGGLIFIAGTEDKKFRAFDKDTGELLWETTLPAAGFATPSTYMSGGRQYVVIAAGGGRGTGPGDYYVAFALPK